MDDTPEGKDDEINPDVLGYIFEKYINQKAFGAYYTRPQITEYLCDRTIYKLIVDRVNAATVATNSATDDLTDVTDNLTAGLTDQASVTSPTTSVATSATSATTSVATSATSATTSVATSATSATTSVAASATSATTSVATSVAKSVAYEDINELLIKLDANLCRLLIEDILPNLSILDPACGSGAFLVAAMKTLIQVYCAVIGTIELIGDRNLKQKLQEIKNSHLSLSYFIKKRIVTDNLYGVDIMEEATEIAKLRLFLALVSSTHNVEELEPLPNIDFNIMAGNSLIGLIRVDETAFDTVGNSLQGNLLQPLAADNYKAILAEKNKSIELYKKHAFLPGEQHGTSQDYRLLSLRQHIDKINRESQEKLNILLLDEFSQRLGIKYEEVQLSGKSKKRVLTAEDIAALKPFHWGYHFDKVLERGGFDAIITNPPWEIFKPQAKEFFAQYSDLVTKNKMDIKTFENEQKKLVANLEIAQAWLEYQSQYPHLSAYYRSAEQYKNLISIVNGKKAGTDINLYKLFVEQCFNLLRTGGECGIVVPSGIYTDLGTKQLREMLFSKTKVTGLFCLENRKEIFEGVHRSFKIVVLTFEKGGITIEFPSAFMRHNVQELQRFPNDNSLPITVEMVRKLSPDSLSVMEFKNEVDIRIAKKMLKFPLLGENIDGKWKLRLTREFDMTNDSHLFHKEYKPGRLPLFTGKLFNQFKGTEEEPLYWIDEKEGRKALLGRIEDKGQPMDYQGYRWVHRRIARNTDSRTLICYITPKNVFTEVNSTTLKVIETGISNQQMLFLCAITNSFTLDWMIRQKVTTTLNMFYIYQLPVPRLTEGDRHFTDIVQRTAKLICTTSEFDELAQEVGLGSHQQGVTDDTERAKLRAELDGMIAHLYGLTEEEFAYILTTFPLVSDTVKQAALEVYRTFALQPTK